MNPANYNPLSSNLNPHLQFSSALNISLHNLKKPDLRQIGHDLKIPSNVLNLNKGSLVEKIVQTIFNHPLFSSFFSRCDLSPFEHCSLLQKILAEAMKKVSLTAPSFHPLMQQSMELYAHNPGMMATGLFRPTTSNFYAEMNGQQSGNNQQQTQHYNTQPHYAAMQQNLCLSSSLMCKNGRQGSLLSCIMPDCTRKFHPECIKMPEKEVEKEAKIFECPQCILEKNDPLNEIKSILLAPFIVTSEQKQFILNHFDLKALNDDQSLGIEIKCIKLDYKYLNEQTWLDSGELYLNNRRIYEFKPLQINSALKKRKDEKCFHRENLTSINTIKFLDFKPNNDQKVNVRYDESAVYMAAVYLVKRLRTDELITKVQKSNVKDAESCKQQILGGFITTSHDDCKISVDKVTISLMDTFFDKQMMQTPAKTVFCTHLQCFSLENFIRAMDIAVPRKWRCPICKVKAFDLMVDGYIWGIIKKLGKNVSASEVIFSEDGSYEVIKTEMDSSNEFDDEGLKKTDSETLKKSDEVQVKKPEIFKKNSNKPIIDIIIVDEDDDTSGETNARSDVSKIPEGLALMGSSEKPKSTEFREPDARSPTILPETTGDPIENSREVAVNTEQDCLPNGNEMNNTHELELEVSVNITHNEEQGPNEHNNTYNQMNAFEVDAVILDRPSEEKENKEVLSQQKPMEIEHLEDPIKNRFLASPRSVTSIRSGQVETIQRGVKDIQITAIPMDENNLNLAATGFLKKSERNLAELQQNPSIRIYNLEDPPMMLPRGLAEESKEIPKPSKRKIEAIEEDLKEKIRNLTQHRSVNKPHTFDDFKAASQPGNDSIKEEELQQSMNLANNMKTKTFLIKVYKKHFPELSKETLNKLAANLNLNSNPNNQTATEPNFPITNTSMLKPPQTPTLPSNFPRMGSTFELPPSSIFPLSMLAAANDKAFLGNNSNYLNFSMNPHNPMALFNEGQAFNNEFQQTHVMKNMNNSFLGNQNPGLPTLLKPGSETLGPKINRTKRSINVNPVETHKVNELKNKGYESNPICLDD